MSKTFRDAICTKKAPAGCQLLTKSQYFSKLTDFENCLHFSILKNRILKITPFTFSMRPKIQIGPKIHQTKHIIYWGAGGRGEALRFAAPPQGEPGVLGSTSDFCRFSVFQEAHPCRRPLLKNLSKMHNFSDFTFSTHFSLQICNLSETCLPKDLQLRLKI